MAYVDVVSAETLNLIMPFLNHDIQILIKNVISDIFTVMFLYVCLLNLSISGHQFIFLVPINSYLSAKQKEVEINF